MKRGKKMAGKDIQEPEDRNGKIIEKDVEKEMKDAYMAYAMSVVIQQLLTVIQKLECLKFLNLC